MLRSPREGLLASKSHMHSVSKIAVLTGCSYVQMNVKAYLSRLWSPRRLVVGKDPNTSEKWPITTDNLTSREGSKNKPKDGGHQLDSFTKHRGQEPLSAGSGGPTHTCVPRAWLCDDTIQCAWDDCSGSTESSKRGRVDGLLTNQGRCHLFRGTPQPVVFLFLPFFLFLPSFPPSFSPSLLPILCTWRG